MKASLLANSGSFIDIKPFVNFTLNAFGVFDDVNEEEPFDPKDSKRIFHSMFQIWNPKVGIRNDVFRQVLITSVSSSDHSYLQFKLIYLYH